jgi:DNA anti-recombination protein RmuC
MSTAEKKQPVDETEADATDEASQVQRDGAGTDSLVEVGNIDKIREILFGGQMRGYEKRFARLEERLLKESTDLRDDTRKRFEALETFVKSEFEALSERLQTEQRTRDESLQTLSRDMQGADQALERKLAQFDEQTTRVQRDLRQQILDQSKNMSEEIRQKYAELVALVERETAELGHAKTDRASLASLFTEVALRLNDDFKIPGNE